jgi:putative ABC transport system substrate-binding protein
VKRREFITLLGGAAAWPLAARAQPMWRVGFLLSAIPASQFGLDDLAGFTQGMRGLGYLEGKDFVIEWRSAEGQYERLPDLAAELVQMKVDVIVAGSTPAVRPAQQATTTIPIVMGNAIDPVGNGFVASLAHPGGNTTGLAGSSDDSSPKQLELLATIVPRLSRVAVLTNPPQPHFLSDNEERPGCRPKSESSRCACRSIQSGANRGRVYCAGKTERNGGHGGD